MHKDSKNAGLTLLTATSWRTFWKTWLSSPGSQIPGNHEMLINQGNQANVMRFSNQSMVGLATVICLLFQGYIFTYVLKVEPDALVSIAPILPFVLYIYARNRRVWWSHKPMYWIAAIIALTMADIAPYALASSVPH